MSTSCEAGKSTLWRLIPAQRRHALPAPTQSGGAPRPPWQTARTCAPRPRSRRPPWQAPGSAAAYQYHGHTSRSVGSTPTCTCTAQHDRRHLPRRPDRGAEQKQPRAHLLLDRGAARLCLGAPDAPPMRGLPRPYQRVIHSRIAATQRSRGHIDHISQNTIMENTCTPTCTRVAAACRCLPVMDGARDGDDGGGGLAR
jgi:hypothetical protein